MDARAFAPGPARLLVVAIGFILLSTPGCRPERSSGPPPPSYGHGAPPPGGHGNPHGSPYGPAQPPPGQPSEAGTNLPADVRRTLEQYVHMLATSSSMEQLVQHFTPIAGGTLVTEDGRSLRNTVPQFSLNKDWQNVRHYKAPPEVTRVVVTPNSSTGYGPSAITGTEYKIWIAKRDPNLGMPAPISLLVPERHAFIQGPRVVGHGSL